MQRPMFWPYQLLSETTNPTGCPAYFMLSLKFQRAQNGWMAEEQIADLKPKTWLRSRGISADRLTTTTTRSFPDNSKYRWPTSGKNTCPSDSTLSATSNNAEVPLDRWWTVKMLSVMLSAIPPPTNGAFCNRNEKVRGSKPCLDETIENTQDLRKHNKE